MSYPLLIEGLSASLGVSRQSVSDFVQKIEDEFESLKGELSRKVSAALSSHSDSAEAAQAVAEVGGQFAFGPDGRDAVGLLLGVVGTIWGAAIVHASLIVEGAVVIAGGALSLPVAIAFIFGAIVMVLCGKFSFGVMVKMIGRIGEFKPDI